MHMTRQTRERRGVVLLAMLVVLSGVGAVVSMMSVSDADFRLSAQNRMTSARDVWFADGCASIVIAAIEGDLREELSPAAMNSAWANLDTNHRHSTWSLLSACHVTFESSGTRIGANQANRESLQILLENVADVGRRDSLIDAYLDWKDADDSVRSSGAESTWYRHARRPLPRNAEFGALEEVRLVKGWDANDIRLDFLQLENERIVLDRASSVVLRMLPGLSGEAIDWIEHNRQTIKAQDLSVIFDHLSPDARTNLQREYARLRGIVSVVPEAWYLECSEASSAKPFRVRLRIVRAGERVRVDRRWELEP